MSTRVTYKRHAERPTFDLWIEDRSGNLIDFSSGYTFSLKVGTRGSTALLAKTSGITGAAGTGTEPTGTPNVVVAWSAGELDLTPGVYEWELTATTGGLDRSYHGDIQILDRIT